MLIAITSDFWVNTENVKAIRVYSDSGSPSVRQGDRLKKVL